MIKKTFGFTYVHKGDAEKLTFKIKYKDAQLGSNVEVESDDDLVDVVIFSIDREEDAFFHEVDFPKGWSGFIRIHISEQGPVNSTFTASIMRDEFPKKVTTLRSVTLSDINMDKLQVKKECSHMYSRSMNEPRPRLCERCKEPESCRACEGHNSVHMCCLVCCNIKLNGEHTCIEYRDNQFGIPTVTTLPNACVHNNNPNLCQVCQRLDKEIDETEDSTITMGKSVMTYSLDADQVRKMEDWKRQIKGLMGEYGYYDIKFSPTGIGTGVEVYSHLIKKSLDLTDVDKW